MRFFSNPKCLIIVLLGFSANGWSQDGAYDCLIEPSVTVEVGSSIRGVAENVLVSRGDKVQQGQILVQLESGVQAASVALAEARSESTAEVDARRESLALARSALKRIEELQRDGNVSRQVFDEARSEAIIAASGLQQAEENRLLAALELQQASEVLALRTIKSSISGIVVDTMISPGELVTEDRPIISLAQIDPLYVEAIIPASDFGRISAGNLATVLPAHPVEGEYQGKVVIVDQVIDAASSTFGVRVELPNPEGKIPAGLNCDVSFSSSDP
ncbi:efflux RND transporter periplasmic adaptor subunit [Seongchinamella sediminis]|uniref:Efflux RND transporter periplasmic adaptor subunit n=1 Tax=Seongchinamella sediminis TaxID=2283635 RepID=A0A3L7E155_9GAMM|nr:efflux RND transporter periplasmic adaptor subunit [Seongchinamella sediminis]RLQ23597.1 efflux RND transporter periplasmic adaptor subunit [Seongchinamella sediminis]